MRSLGRHTGSFLLLFPDSYEIRVVQRNVNRRIVNPVKESRISQDFRFRSSDAKYRSVHMF